MSRHHASLPTGQPAPTRLTAQLTSLHWPALPRLPKPRLLRPLLIRQTSPPHTSAYHNTSDYPVHHITTRIRPPKSTQAGISTHRNYDKPTSAIASHLSSSPTFLANSSRPVSLRPRLPKPTRHAPPLPVPNDKPTPAGPSPPFPMLHDPDLPDLIEPLHITTTPTSLLVSGLLNPSPTSLAMPRPLIPDKPSQPNSARHRTSPSPTSPPEPSLA